MLQFFLLMIVMLCCYERGPVAELSPSWAAGAAVLTFVLASLAAEVIAAIFTRRVWYHRADRYRQLRMYHRFRLGHTVLTLGLFLVAIYVADWDVLVRNHWGLATVPVVALAVIVLPLLLSFLAAWTAFYRVELVLHQTASSAFLNHPFWTRGEFVLFQFRQQFGLVLATALLFVSLNSLADRLFPNLQPDSWNYLLVHGTTFAVVFLTLPWLMTIIWPTRSLAAGPLRHQLESTARRLHFRCTDIRLWDTGGSMANALVTGMLPVPRYVLLSDVLVEALHPEEIEAVFGHEMGHVRHHHIPFFVLFLMLSTFLFTLAGEPIVAWLSPRLAWLPGVPGTGHYSPGYWLAHGLIFFGVGAYVWLVFGLVSRVCERQADVFGCKVVQAPPSLVPASVSPGGNGYGVFTTHAAPPPPPPGTLQPHGIRVFVSALQKVASLNGIDPYRPSWRHGSIAKRIRFLETLLHDEQAEPRFQRQALFLKLGLVLTLVGLVGLCWWLTGGLTL